MALRYLIGQVKRLSIALFPRFNGLLSKKLAGLGPLRMIEKAAGRYTPRQFGPSEGVLGCCQATTGTNGPSVMDWSFAVRG